MIATTFPLLLAALGGGVSAQILARLVPQNLTERAVRAAGGFGIVPEKFCPNDLTNCNNGEFCCPTSLTCAASPADYNDGFCCAGTEDCTATYVATPYCADDTWTIWDRSQGGIASGGYFCCDTGLVGLLTGTCIDPSALLSPTLEALQIAPGGGVLSTSTVTTSTAVAISVTGTTIATTVTTTSTSASTATTGVTIIASGNSTTSASKSSSTTKSASTLSSSTSAGISTALTTPSSSSASASPSTTKSSDGNTYKIAGLGSIWLVRAALAVFVGAAL